MYTSFHIKNFRCFEDLEFNDLARINLIGGKNNVGKTSVLEAILLHRGRFDTVLSRMEIDIVDPRRSHRLYDEIITSGLHDWRNLFYGLDASRTITFSGVYQDVPELIQTSMFDENFGDDILTLQIVPASALEEHELRRLTPRSSRVDYLPDMDVLRFSMGKDHYHMVLYDDRATIDRVAPFKHINSIFLPARRSISVKDNVRRFSKLMLQLQTSLLDDVLQIIEPRIREVKLLDVGLYADVEGFNGLIPLDSMGEGIGRITSAVLAITDTPNGIVLIDEIENGLHYSILKDIWLAIAGAAKTFNVQVFATTHSFEMIQAANDAFEDSSDDEFRYHRLDRSQKTGKISIKTYADEVLEAAFASNLEVR